MARGVIGTRANAEDVFRNLLVAGRWLLVAAETVETVLLLPDLHRFRFAIPVLTVLFLYNALSLVVVHRAPLERVPVLAMIVLDALFVAVAAYYTGGADSPFIGHYYLIILAASLFFGLRGGLGVSLFALIVTVDLTFQNPEQAWLNLRNTAIYFVIVGVFTGYLSSQFRIAFSRYQQSQSDIRNRELQAEVSRREMELARAMQQAALAAMPPSVPGLDIATRLEFAHAVGGDFYLFLTEGDRLGVVVGDVSGKGLPAALISTTLAHLLPSLRPLRHPQVSFRRLNEDLSQRLPSSAFVTLVLAEISLRESSIYLWNAGHPPALLWSQRDHTVREATCFNQLLGSFSSWHGDPEYWPFNVGDVLVLYSDGLIEARNTYGELFDVSRVGSVLMHYSAHSAQEIADALIDAAQAWGAITDDITVVVCKRVSVSNAVATS